MCFHMLLGKGALDLPSLGVILMYQPQYLSLLCVFLEMRTNTLAYKCIHFLYAFVPLKIYMVSKCLPKCAQTKAGSLGEGHNAFCIWAGGLQQTLVSVGERPTVRTKPFSGKRE